MYELVKDVSKMSERELRQEVRRLRSAIIRVKCWHFWRRRYSSAAGGTLPSLGPLCDKCLKKHPDYWKWKLVLREHGVIDWGQMV